MGIFTSQWHLESCQNTYCHCLLKIIVASALPLILVAEQLGEGPRSLSFLKKEFSREGKLVQ